MSESGSMEPHFPTRETQLLTLIWCLSFQFLRSLRYIGTFWGTSQVCAWHSCFVAICNRHEVGMDHTEGALPGLTMINAEDHDCTAISIGVGFLLWMALVTLGETKNV